MHEKKGRSENLMFFVTPAEKLEIKRRAEEAKKTVSGYLRSLALRKEKSKEE